MIRGIALLVGALSLAACAILGPPAIVLSRSDIAQRAFVDRDRSQLNRVFERFENLDLSGPDVGFQTTAQRVQLEWTLRTRQAVMGVPLEVSIAISGRPDLNTTRTGIDLADARIEHVRLPSLPFIDAAVARMPAGESLGVMPLLTFRPEELTRDGVVYEATGVSLGTFGLRVDLVPK